MTKTRDASPREQDIKFNPTASLPRDPLLLLMIAPAFGGFAGCIQYDAPDDVYRTDDARILWPDRECHTLAYLTLPSEAIPDGANPEKIYQMKADLNVHSHSSFGPDEHGQNGTGQVAKVHSYGDRDAAAKTANQYGLNDQSCPTIPPVRGQRDNMGGMVITEDVTVVLTKPFHKL